MRSTPFLLTMIAATGLSAAAHALPATVTATDTDRDATVTLTIFDQAISGDARSRCSVRVQAGSGEIPFTAGDTIIVRVREDDIGFDDTLFQTSFEISSQELAMGLVDRTLDCSSNFGTDGVGQSEIYAEAEINKDECGFFCNTEDPQTGNIDVAEVNDDDAEQDDGPGAAAEIPVGLTQNRIARDQDWIALSIEEAPSDVRFTVLHHPPSGRIEVTLFDADNRRLADSVDNAENSILVADALEPGQYRLRVSPQQDNDFNFYDARLLIDPILRECVPGERDEESCGNCGTMARVCGDDGHFGPFGECGVQGECAPGDQRTTACGNCGTSLETCSDACGWEPAGTCEGEGECARDAVETVECPGGSQSRVCNDTCQWGDFGECRGDECQDGEAQPCYDGPAGTEGVGLCAAGRQFCEAGRWSACQGQLLPTAEQCADGRDNDCDGAADDQDQDCAQEGAEIGSACRVNGECAGELICLVEPGHSQFVGGYCGKDDCDSSADCGADGVCGGIFGQNFCLRSCAGDADCRRGYLCVSLDGGGRGCAPACDSNDDCADALRPVCEVATGLCVAGDVVDPPNNDTPNNDTPNNDAPNNDGPDLPIDDGDPGAAPASDDGCGCATPAAPVPTGPMGLLALLAGLALVARRRRR